MTRDSIHAVTSSGRYKILAPSFTHGKEPRGAVEFQTDFSHNPVCSATSRMLNNLVTAGATAFDMLLFQYEDRVTTSRVQLGVYVPEGG